MKVELFNVWGINFLCPFPPYGNRYILVAVDYVSKWVEVKAYQKNDAKVVIRFLQKHNVRDEGSYFVNKWLKRLLEMNNVRNKIVIAYHTQTNREDDLTNKEIKGILEKVVRPNRRDWSKRLDDALWAYRTTFKTPLGRFPYRIMFEKVFHLLLELDIKAF